MRLAQSFSHVQLCDTLDCSPPVSPAHGILQARSGLPYPPPGDLPGPGIEHESLLSSALAGGFFTTEPPGKPTSLPQCSCRISQHALQPAGYSGRRRTRTIAFSSPLLDGLFFLDVCCLPNLCAPEGVSVHLSASLFSFLSSPCPFGSCCLLGR